MVLGGTCSCNECAQPGRRSALLTPRPLQRLPGCTMLRHPRSPWRPLRCVGAAAVAKGTAAATIATATAGGSMADVI